MSCCIWCGSPDYRIGVFNPDVAVAACPACWAEVTALGKEFAQVVLPGRNDDCPECLAVGVRIKLKKCLVHNDVQETCTVDTMNQIIVE